MRYISLLLFFLFLSCTPGIVRVEISEYTTPPVVLVEGSRYAVLQFKGDTLLGKLIFRRLKGLERADKLKATGTIYNIPQDSIKEFKEIDYILYGHLSKSIVELRDTTRRLIRKGDKVVEEEGYVVEAEGEVEVWVKDLKENSVLFHDFLDAKEKDFVFPKDKTKLKEVKMRVTRRVTEILADKIVQKFTPRTRRKAVYLIQSDKNVTGVDSTLKKAAHYAILGAWGRARYEWERISQNSYAANYNIGIFWEREHRFERALTYYRKALSMCGECPHRKLIERAIERVVKLVQ